MLKHLHKLNFVLLLAIGGLCFFQWNTEKEARRRINELQKTTLEHERKISEQADNLKGAGEDLDRFRTQVAALKATTDEQTVQIRQQKGDLFTLEENKKALTKQLDSWKQALDGYKAAVANRDENIKTLLEQRDQLLGSNKAAVEKANLAIVSYNELNGKYGDLVNRYNEIAVKYQALTAQAGSQAQEKQAN